jgi:hypothetical protein
MFQIIQITFDESVKLDGLALLSVDNVETLLKRGLSKPPSLLIYRLKLYQGILRALDQLWDVKNPRQRPGDIYISDTISPQPDPIKRKANRIKDNDYVQLGSADEILHSLMAMNRLVYFYILHLHFRMNEISNYIVQYLLTFLILSVLIL